VKKIIIKKIIIVVIVTLATSTFAQRPLQERPLRLGMAGALIGAAVDQHPLKGAARGAALGIATGILLDTTSGCGSSYGSSSSYYPAPYYLYSGSWRPDIGGWDNGITYVCPR